MKKSATFVLIALLSGCSGLAPHYDFKPVMPQVMPLADPTDPGPRNSGTIYQAGTDMRLFEDRTARRIGDSVVIRLIEKTAATKSATTSVDKSSEIDIQNPTLFGVPFTAGAVTLENTANGERKLGGEGSSDQSNSLTGNISAVVVAVYPNGNLAIRGRENADPQSRRGGGANFRESSGPRISLADNSILSSRVADAKITYAGNGTLADANTVGWLGRFFLSPLWPF